MRESWLYKEGKKTECEILGFTSEKVVARFVK